LTYFKTPADNQYDK